MNIEELVRESLDRGVETLPRGVPDPDRITKRGRRRAAVRVAVPAVAAVAVIAAVSVVAVDRFGSDEPPVAGTDDPATYMSWSGEVHIDARTYHAQHAKGDAFEVNAMTAAGFVYLGGDDYPYLIGRDGAERRIGDSTNPGNAKSNVTTMAGSADQRYAAWASPGSGELRVSLFDAAAGKVVEHRSIDCGAILSGNGLCQEYSVTAVADGVVYLDGVSQGRMVSLAWDPSLPASEQVYRTTDPGTTVSAVAAKTVLVTGDGAVYDRFGEPVGDDWTIVRTERMDDESDPYTLSTLTADGRWYFVVGGMEETAGEGTSYAVDSTTGERVELVPNTDGVRIDDDGSVLVLTNGNNSTDQDILDCALPSGECTTVVEDVGENDALIGEG